MTEQLSGLTPGGSCRALDNGTPTSRAAADSLGGAHTQLARVYAALAEPRTADEIDQLLGLNRQAAARIHTLAGKNGKHPMAARIKDTGETRKTRSGRRAVVWVAMDQDAARALR